MVNVHTPGGNSRPRWVRIVGAGAALLTGWHIFASFLWIGPPTPLREVVPGDALTSYMIPWFGQSWSVFAPEPINGDYRLKVRAIVRDDDGNEKATDWVSATDVEASMAHHNLFPPRASSLAIKQASQFKAAYDKLTGEQQEIAKLNYYKGDDWLGRMMIAMNEVANDSNKQAVTSYIVRERHTDAYATQVAKAVWGDSVVQVQYEISRQNIIPFTERHNPDAVRPAPVVASTGWRGLITLEGQSEDHFSDIFGNRAKEIEK